MRLRMCRKARVFVIAFSELCNFLIPRQRKMCKQKYLHTLRILLMRLRRPRKARLFAIAFAELGRLKTFYFKPE